MTKKNLREMEATVAEQRSRTQKSEREYTTLKDSIEGMKRNWRTDIDGLREEMGRRDEKARAEAAVTGKKYRKMADELKASQTDGESIKKMKAEDEKIRKEIEDGFRDQITVLKDEMAKQARENSEAVNTARSVIPPLSPTLWAHMCLQRTLGGTWSTAKVDETRRHDTRPASTGHRRLMLSWISCS
jgi:hypothetical protein